MSDQSDANPFTQAFFRMGERMSLPRVTVEDVVTHHRRNIEALQETARNTSAATQQAFGMQREALENVLKDIADTVQTTKLTDPPTSQAAAHAELAKRTLDTTIRNATAIGGLARDTTQENFEVLRERVQGSIQEIKSAIERGEEEATEDAPVKEG